jgi:hypothetical protein
MIRTSPFGLLVCYASGRPSLERIDRNEATPNGLLAVAGPTDPVLLESAGEPSGRGDSQLNCAILTGQPILGDLLFLHPLEKTSEGAKAVVPSVPRLMSAGTAPFVLRLEDELEVEYAGLAAAGATDACQHVALLIFW